MGMLYVLLLLLGFGVLCVTLIWSLCYIAPATSFYITLSTIPERLKSATFRTYMENLLSQDPHCIMVLNIPEVYLHTG